MPEKWQCVATQNLQNFVVVIDCSVQIEVSLVGTSCPVEIQLNNCFE